MTPKGGPTQRAKTPDHEKPSSPGSSTRYTPPAYNAHLESPLWVPIVMFGLFGIGMLVIFLHYVNVLLPGADSNWYLLVGLGAILGGIMTATQYR